jgi:hypothetical protein
MNQIFLDARNQAGRSCVYTGMSMDALLPNDLEACQRELLQVRSVLAETAVTCEEQQVQIEKLRAELELFQRYLFGRRRERFIDSPGQGQLFDPPSAEETPAEGAAKGDRYIYRSLWM